jgi:very-short-patch-repair endonuclease
MSADSPREIVAKARQLRRSMTIAEHSLWRAIRDKQLNDFRFRRQRPIGKYIVDFVCLEAMLILEVDGGQHAERMTYDEKRTTFLEQLGYRVLRFWNNDVLQNLEGVVEKILIELAARNNDV